MKVKTFYGRTMAEALRQVKLQLGPEAVILNTRTVNKAGLWGLRGRSTVQITAAPNFLDLPKPMRRGTLPVSRPLGDKADGAADLVPGCPKPSNGLPTDALFAEIGALKQVVSDLAQETRRAGIPSIPAPLFDHYSALIRNEVSEQLAREIIDRVLHDLTPDQLRDPPAVRAHLAKCMEAMLPTAGAVRFGPLGEPTVIALIGPTGVGKTTTAAKLAANFCLREQRKVGLITIDTYRIAAVEQLRTYAQIINVPLEVVMSPEQLRDAVGRLSDCDVILIDTAGRSPRDTIKVRELKRFFSVVRPTEIHLVLSIAANDSYLKDAVERFSEVGVDRVIFTKLDEAIGFGVILTCLAKVNAKLSYLTTGQDVPDDILVAESRSLAELILGGTVKHQLASGSLV